MRITADLHIHSHYSRATSSKLNPLYLDRWARIKGIHLIGTGDCTHPRWLSDLRGQLEESEEGFYTLRQDIIREFNSGLSLSEGLPVPGNMNNSPRFVLTGEISTIYSRDGKTRKVHHVVILPDFKAAAAFQTALARIGNITSDGRPIIGIDSRDLLAILLEADERSLLIPAHIWTPWFSALGARSGFDSIDECYRDLTRYIYAIETGLSSNPPMNWAVGSLDRFAIISNSDAHSPEKLGREATVFEMDMSYTSLVSAIKGKDEKHDIAETIEFFPQEGKYHYDGHRNCSVYLSPEETSLSGGRCPVCGKTLTQGVMRRVIELADTEVNETAPCPVSAAGTNRRPYFSLIPLPEILSEIIESGVSSKKVGAAYSTLISKAGSEFSLLKELDLHEVEKLNCPGVPGELLAEAIGRMRSGDVSISPGYDGEYGVIHVFSPGEKAQKDLTPDLFGDGAEKLAAKKNHSAEQKKKTKGPEKKRAADTEKKTAKEEKTFTPDQEQTKAIRHRGGPAIVIAGPGTGKTAVLVSRILHILDSGVKASGILAITFTVKAAGELAKRIEVSAGPEAAGDITAATFHSFCMSVLRENADRTGLSENFTILSEAERIEILNTIIDDYRKNEAPAGKKRISVQGLGKYIEQRKRFLLLPGNTVPCENNPLQPDLLALAYETGIPEADSEMEMLYGKFRDRLRFLGSLDFDDLISGTVRLFIRHPEILEIYRTRFRFVFVDEFQDVNFAQYALIRTLCPSEKTETFSGSFPQLYVIGDPNQAIYGFRGSDRRFVEHFLTDYSNASQYNLIKSFRCAEPIIHAAGTLMDTELSGTGSDVMLYRCGYPGEKSEAEGIARRISKLIGGTSFFAFDSGVVNSAPEYNEGLSQEESPLKNLGDCAILIRTAALAPPIQKALHDHGIPYDFIGEKPWWEENEAGAVLDILRTEKKTDRNNTVTQDAEIIAPQLPARAVEHAWELLNKKKKETPKNIPEPVQRLISLAELYDNLPAFLDMLAIGSPVDGAPAKKEGVALMTIHASKGLEFDYVFAAGLEEGLLPFTLYDKENGEDSERIEEERRLLYVAMTRARKGLYLSWAQSRMFLGRKLERGPSRFLNQLETIIPLLREGELKQEKKDTQLQLLF
ncbi:UvrD-helicase domain-containing protein [Brucepastera parasyntrophica]|uniref:UvrD-helicase domain-containing protein n=1 Tax=Brucepastera parasyntrophica TaxID=2880008 RepID=UPI00210A6FF2|nr:UvrD-helicase domain-containing protein [Brucepastera parasyntrophica]ULQ60466.1 UvrD-helicase domain-containing protein [Brucepastera parasyntrophica]